MPSDQADIKQRVTRVLSSFEHFIRDESVGGAILFVAATAAIVIANSGWASGYHDIVGTYVKIEIGDKSVEGTLHGWVNEGLMVLFFFVLGLEIKREVIVGELKKAKLAIPVMAAALGGMFMPAIIFVFMNIGTPYIHGWGIPMATDTAFAIGVLSIVGSKNLAGAASFLTALAIMDDIGAIIVIAIFYSENISIPYIAAASLIFLGMIGLNMAGVRRPGIYLSGGVVLWLVMLASGIHATTAGILAAFATPARPSQRAVWLLARVQRLIKDFEIMEKRHVPEQSILADNEQHAVIEGIEAAVEQATTPLQRWERALERPIALFVLPVFALMNAGVSFNKAMMGELFTSTLTQGIIFGLVGGKVLGIVGGAWVVLRLGIGVLPASMNIRHVIGIGLLGGMGFTMSMFIAGLGVDSDQEALELAKMAIITASVIAGLLGYLWLRFVAAKDA